MALDPPVADERWASDAMLARVKEARSRDGAADRFRGEERYTVFKTFGHSPEALWDEWQTVKPAGTKPREARAPQAARGETLEVVRRWLRETRNSDGVCKASIRLIAEATGLDHKAVGRAIAMLERTREVVRVPVRWGYNGRPMMRVYYRVFDGPPNTNAHI